MKRKYQIATLLIAALAFGTLASEAIVGSTVSAVSTSAVQSGYLLKAYDGKLAVFDSANPDQGPLEVYDVYLQNLPPYDQEQLTNGLWFADEESLLNALYDFES
jgi:hypothetical protein